MPSPQSNPFLFALVGLPLVLGVYLRFKRHNRSALIESARVTAVVFLAVGIGYAFAHFDNPRFLFTELGTLICGMGAFLLPIVLFWLVEDFDEGMMWTSWLVAAMALLFAGLLGQQQIIAAAAAVLLLLAAGLMNALLGTIAAGFALSAAAHSLATTGTLDYVFLWKDVFEFFEIASTPMKILVLSASGVVGAVEAIRSFME
jgi:hypothetical protein